MTINQNIDMKILLGALLAIVSMAWGVDLFTGDGSGGSLLWVIQQEALYISGLLAITMMSLAMFLSTRPTWLEDPLDGMDRIYHLHKWAGILTGSFAILHWLSEEIVGDILKEVIGREGRVPKEKYSGLFAVMRDLASDMGEWAFYAVLVMLAITLWKQFPYKIWKLLHQAMPVIYLMLVFHAVMLAPSDYWTQPIGIVLSIFVAGGIVGAISSLMGRIGHRRQVQGKVIAIAHLTPEVVTVSCQLGNGWHGHRPGQFAFVTFDAQEGAHPFTIASADHGDRVIDFQIKALGDYTRTLGHALQIGQTINVEGPYGRFDIARQDSRAQQLWIAGGIGITPFLAWLDSLQGKPRQVAAYLHYYTGDRTHDPFVARLESSCTSLAGVNLHIHSTQHGEMWNIADITSAQEGKRRFEIWFCGPQGLAKKIQQDLQILGHSQFSFHQEVFAIR